MPVTFYASDSDLPDFEDYHMANRTYKYFTGKALYPFGYGLSYTQFAYSWNVQPKSEYTADEIIECSLKVKNTGMRDGDAVVYSIFAGDNSENEAILANFKIK